MEIIKQICEMCRYKNQSNATFPCVDCCSRDRWELAETIVVSSKAIQSYQQEIDRLKRQLSCERQTVSMLKSFGLHYGEFPRLEADKLIDKLVKDKDEQAGRLMQLDSENKKLREGLRRTMPILETSYNYRHVLEDTKNMLGGNDDAEKPQT